MHVILYKTAEFYVLNQPRSILLVPPSILLKIRFGHFSAFSMTSSPSHVI